MAAPTLDRLTAADVMTTHVVAVTPNDSLRDAMSMLVNNHVSGAPVVDGEGRCVGVISATDILNYEQDHAGGIDEHNEAVAQVYDAESNRWESVRVSAFALERIAHVPVADVMTRDPVVVSGNASLSEVARKMLDQNVHRVLVTDSSHKVRGIISTTDFVRALAKVPATVRPTAMRAKPRKPKARLKAPTAGRGKAQVATANRSKRRTSASKRR